METGIDVVIVNFNAGDLLVECVNSLRSDIESGSIRAVVVVDNASEDDSVALARKAFPDANYFVSSRNLGFAAACNLGACQGNSDWILFLNPDARLVEESGSILLNALASTEFEDVGTLGVPLIDGSGMTARTCSRFPRLSAYVWKALGLERWASRRAWSQPMLEWDHGQTREVDQVIGAFFLVRRKLFDELRGFDERFFVYYEEVDFCKRARDLGWKCTFFAGLKAFHQGWGSSRKVKARRLFYSLRSRMLYGAKHFGTTASLGLLVLTLVMEPLTRATHRILRLDASGLWDLIKGYALLWRDIPNWGVQWLCLRRESARR